MYPNLYLKLEARARCGGLDCPADISYEKSNHVIIMSVVAVAVVLSLAFAPGQVGHVPATVPLRTRPALCATEAPEAPEAPMVERPKIETTCGFDYVPLLTALQAGEFREADQLTRDALITLAGEKAVDRGYVYFTEVPNLPVEDMATIERLWQAYSGGKFGYAVQAQAYMSKKVNKNFETFFERIGWKKADGTLVRWLPEAKNDEFIYDVDKAPKGHLPLTSTLRGQQLLKGLLTHKAWQRAEFKDVTF